MRQGRERRSSSSSSNSTINSSNNSSSSSSNNNNITNKSSSISSSRLAVVWEKLMQLHQNPGPCQEGKGPIHPVVHLVVQQQARCREGQVLPQHKGEQ